MKHNKVDPPRPAWPPFPCGCDCIRRGNSNIIVLHDGSGERICACGLRWKMTWIKVKTHNPASATGGKKC
jgi:hypothetical protein